MPLLLRQNMFYNVTNSDLVNQITYSRDGLSGRNAFLVKATIAPSIYSVSTSCDGVAISKPITHLTESICMTGLSELRL